MEQTTGKRIMANRKRMKLTQEQLAEKLGVTAQAVSKWENNQSYPDISILPKLAEIFDTTTDELLGRNSTHTVCEAEVVDNNSKNSKWDFHRKNGRRDSLGFAVLVLWVGALYLLSQMLDWELSLWNILWPSAFLVFGIWGLIKQWSFFRLGCVIFGGYNLADNIFQFSFNADSKLIWAILILLFGISLAADALKKPSKPRIKINGNKKPTEEIQIENDTFTYTGKFGAQHHRVEIPTLRYGAIAVSFGDFTVDFSDVAEFAPDCKIGAACAFGELHLIFPNNCRVVLDKDATFASINIHGTPNEETNGRILLGASAEFGEIQIEYV